MHIVIFLQTSCYPMRVSFEFAQSHICRFGQYTGFVFTLFNGGREGSIVDIHFAFWFLLRQSLWFWRG